LRKTRTRLIGKKKKFNVNEICERGNNTDESEWQVLSTKEAESSMRHRLLTAIRKWPAMGWYNHVLTALMPIPVVFGNHDGSGMMW